MQTVFIAVWLDFIVCFNGLIFCSVLVSDDEIKKINQNDFCFSRQNRLSFTLDIWDKESIGPGKCTEWPFGDLDPRARLWHGQIKIGLSAG